MKRLVLKRFCYAPFGVYGCMEVGGRILYTVERPWLDNRPQVSCIPEATYKLALDPFRGQYNAPLLLGVPGRSQIQIHIANAPSQLKGCIAVGWNVGWVQNQWAVLSSRSAFGYLMGFWPYGEIEIVNDCDETQGIT